MATHLAFGDKGGAAPLAGLGVLVAITAYNASGTPVFLLIGDSASEMPNGTVPKLPAILLPANTQLMYLLPTIERFTAGLAWSVSSTRATVTATGSDADFDVALAWA